MHKIWGVLVFMAMTGLFGVFGCAAQAVAENYYDYVPNPPLTQQQQTAMQQILNETSGKLGPLHDELARKEAELQGILDSTTPDQGRIASLSREIGDLRGKIMNAQIEMRGKLANAGIPAVPTQRYVQPNWGQQWNGGCPGGPNCWGAQGGYGAPCWGGNFPRHGRGHYGYHHGYGMMGW